jgi:predicted DNA-binding transcriptional regulator AlpA
MRKTFWTADEVAEYLGFRCKETFLKGRDAMEALMGFPPPLPYLARPLRWRSDQIEAWLENQGTPEADGDNVVDLGARRAMMQAARSA